MDFGQYCPAIMARNSYSSEWTDRLVVKYDGIRDADRLTGGRSLTDRRTASGMVH